jgi:predicted DNA-binding protein
MTAYGPLSVVLPDALRERLEHEAKKRGLPLSTAVRALVAERVREIDEAAELSAADQWQRAQAWRDWEKVRAGEMAEVTRDELLQELGAPSSPRRRKARKRRP